MKKFLTQLFFCVLEELPYVPRPSAAQEALRAALTEEQLPLFEAYLKEELRNTTAELEQLFYFTLRLALNMP